MSSQYAQGKGGLTAPKAEVMGDAINPKALCPTIWVYGNKGTKEAPSLQFMPCKFRWLENKVDIHIATAFCVSMFQCVVPLAKGQKAAATLQVPMHPQGTISEIFVQNDTKNSVYVTAVVPTAETKGFRKTGPKVNLTDDRTPVADPTLTQIILPSVGGGEVLTCRIVWFQPLDFKEGRYHLTLPTRMVPDSLDTASGVMSAAKATTIHCNIFTGNPGKVPWCNNSHPMVTVREFDGRVELKADSERPWGNYDFSIGFNVWNDAILASLNVQLATPKSLDQRGTFCLSIAPPNPKSIQSVPRAVLFLLDRSGSMVDEPLEFAKRALLLGLSLLRETDYFSMIAYDHNQMVFKPQLIQGTPANIEAAQAWVAQVKAGGMTDILTPLTVAADMIGMGPQGLLPQIFLITDGKVENEREICNWALHLPQDVRWQGRALPRINTFAIGPYANAVFLKQLAASARGLTDVALRPEQIQTQMERLLLCTEKPVLFDIALGIQGIADCELYPFPIPDLFCGNPLVVSGKFTGAFPGSISLNGTLHNGAPWTQVVNTTMLSDTPLDKVFIKGQLDLLAAKAWLAEDKKLEQKVIDISVRENIPSAYTTMVGFEVTQRQYQEYIKMKNHRGMSAGKVAALSVGGAAAVGIVGIAVLSFGDLGASIGNLPVGDALSAIGSGLGGITGDLLSGLGDLGGTIGDACGECCGSCDVNVFTECVASIGQCVSETCGCIGDCLNINF